MGGTGEVGSEADSGEIHDPAQESLAAIGKRRDSVRSLMSHLGDFSALVEIVRTQANLVVIAEILANGFEELAAALGQDRGENLLPTVRRVEEGVGTMLDLHSDYTKLRSLLPPVLKRLDGLYAQLHALRELHEEEGSLEALLREVRETAPSVERLGSALGRLAEVSTKFDAYWERQRRVAEVASRVESLSALLHKAELLAKRDEEREADLAVALVDIRKQASEMTRAAKWMETDGSEVTDS